MPRLKMLPFVVLFGCALSALLAGQIPPPPPSPAGQPRDPSQPATRTVPIGTALISGTIAAVDTGRPLRRARVTLSGSATVPAGRGAPVPAAAGGRGTPLTIQTQVGIRGGIPGGVPGEFQGVNFQFVSGGMGVSRTVITDAQGQFSFPRLPAGQYTLNVMRDQYLATAYGQKKPGRQGTTIDLAEGQQMKVNIAMIRGGVITGMVTNEEGEPLSNAQVRALRFNMSNGVRRLVGAGGASTDDRGVYRLFNLQPGEYVVSATPSGSDIMMADRMLAETAALEAAIQAAATRGGGANQPTSVTIPVPPPNQMDQPTGYAATYYPNTAMASGASTLAVNAGEERNGVDIQVLPIRSGNIQGMVINPAGQTAVQVSINTDDPMAEGINMSSTRVGPDGRFTFRNIAPGQYTLTAQTVPPPPAPPPPPGPNGVVQYQPPARLDDSQRLWGRAQVMVDGQSTPMVTLSLQPGKSIAGMVVFDYSKMPAPDLSRTRMTVTPSPAPSTTQMIFGQLPQGTVGPDGRFTITGVLPGKYILRVSGGGTLKSSVVNGEDTLDFPLDFTAERDLTNAVITLTDRSTELSGQLTEASGKPGSEYTIIIAPTDTRYWTPGARRISMSRPSTDGRYTFRNLPPGDYMLAAVTDIEPGGQFDPEFLKQLSAASMRLTLTEGGRQTQDIRVAR